MELLLKLRIPSWVDETRGPEVIVNGEEWAGCQAAAGHMAGSFCTVNRSFSAGADPHSSLANRHALPSLQNASWYRVVSCTGKGWWHA